MKLLIRCDQTLQAAHIANALRAAGIACDVRNTTLSSAIGDIPFLECAPQVWIVNDLDEPRARILLRELMQPEGSIKGPPWRCASCGEELEPQFGACWACGAPRA